MKGLDRAGAALAAFLTVTGCPEGTEPTTNAIATCDDLQATAEDVWRLEDHVETADATVFTDGTYGHLVAARAKFDQTLRGLEDVTGCLREMNN